MIKDKDFFGKESVLYSDKRYPARASSYTQFFFKRRLEIVLAAMARSMEADTTYDVLEVGCADGVVLRALYDKFVSLMRYVIGVDIAPDMIAAAKRANAGRPITYLVREGTALPGTFDMIVEIGVLNYTHWRADLKAAHNALPAGGTYFCSFASRSSLLARLKGGEESYENILPYEEYERELRRTFTIVRTIPCGYFIPFIWKFAPIGRTLQKFAEPVLSRLVPNLAHEKVYVLRK